MLCNVVQCCISGMVVQCCAMLCNVQCCAMCNVVQFCNIGVVGNHMQPSRLREQAG